MRLVLVCLLPACVVGDVSVESATPPAETAAEGIVTAPRHGDVVGGDTRALTLDVTGTHSIADYRIDVQVLDQPLDPTSWITIGTTLTASSSETGAYAWKLLVAPAREEARRWPAGGVVRVRAVGERGELLAVMFHDRDERAPVTNGMILVSPSPTPAEALVRPRFLDRRSAADVPETLEYYAAIDAPPTLADFQARFPTTVTTTFYNAGDLGIGREMHCGAQAGGAVACYVSNYGVFGGDRGEALNAAVARTGAFATVAMVYTPPATAPNSVRFMVYGANGQLVTQAQLDQYGDNVSIPNNCLNCHGGARYDAAANAVLGARFLPFDTSGFEFSDLPGFRPADQAANVRALNELVATTDPTPAIRDLIAGFDASGADDFVPTWWSGARDVYQQVVAVACRSCHASLGSSFDFTSAAQFTSLRASIADSVCGPSGTAAAHDMPSAEIPLRRLWTTSARAYLIDYLDIKGACEP
jgi:hypothetical protein